MKKLALVLGLTTALFACHEKEPQNQSGVNDPINIVYGDVDSTVLTLDKSGKAPEVKSEVAETPCIDSSKINPDQMCTQQVDPVCGCDGNTYSNSCEAEKAGVTKWEKGECK